MDEGVNVEIYKNTLFLEELVKESKKVYFSSSFKFLQNHKGWRPKKIHFLIAPTGAGKSTLLRSLILDVVENNPKKKILLYLTEESLQDFWTELAQSGFDLNKFRNITAISEQSYNDNEMVSAFKRFKFYAEEYRPDIIFVDNLSTMTCYGDDIKAQPKVIKAFKKMAHFLSLPIFILGHTSAEIKEGFQGMIDMSHVRGIKKSTIESEFVYTLQPVTINETRKSFLSIKKSRGQEIKKSLFQLYYHKGAKIFAGDKDLNFDEFKEIFNQRNKL